jgi:hypothetical protein
LRRDGDGYDSPYGKWYALSCPRFVTWLQAIERSNVFFDLPVLEDAVIRGFAVVMAHGVLVLESHFRWLETFYPLCVIEKTITIRHRLCGENEQQEVVDWTGTDGDNLFPEDQYRAC